MERLYSAVERRFSANAEALADLALETPSVDVSRIGWWYTVKQENTRGQVQEIRIDGRHTFTGFLKPVNNTRGCHELTAGLLATQIGAPAAPCILIGDSKEKWLFSAATFDQTVPPRLQSWAAGDAFLQGMAGQFLAFAGDSDRHAFNHVYAETGEVCLFDFQTRVLPFRHVQPEIMGWQVRNRPLVPLGLRRRAYDRGARLMAKRIAELKSRDIEYTIITAAEASLGYRITLADIMVDPLLERQRLFRRGPVRPSMADTFQFAVLGMGAT